VADNVLSCLLLLLSGETAGFLKKGARTSLTFRRCAGHSRMSTKCLP